MKSEIPETDYLKILEYIDQPIYIVKFSKKLNIIYKNHNKRISLKSISKMLHSFNSSDEQLSNFLYNKDINLEIKKINNYDYYLIKVRENNADEKQLFKLSSLDIEDTFIHYNRIFKRQFIHDNLTELIGEKRMDFINKTPREKPIVKKIGSYLTKSLHDVKAKKTSKQLVINYKNSLFYNISIIPEIDEKNTVSSYFVHMRNHTKEKINEFTLKKKESHFRTIVENTPDTICRHNLNCERIYCNPHAIKFLCTKNKDLLYSSPRDYPGGESGILCEEKIKEVIKKQTPIEFELQFEINNKKTYLEIKLVPEYDSKENIISVLSIGRDITLIKQYRDALEKNQTKLRDLEAHRERSFEMERKRIAREVHDELGQQLTGLKMSLQSLQLREDTSPAIKQNLDCINNQLQKTISFTRHLVSKLRPSSLDLGVVTAIEWLIDDFNKMSADCHCYFSTNCSSIKISEESSVNIFRIIQEALTNITKHSKATNIRVLIFKIEGYLEISIQDNGCGFDTDDESKKNSFGLIGMKERALIISADINIESKINKGTLLTLKVPL